MPRTRSGSPVTSRRPAAKTSRIPGGTRRTSASTASVSAKPSRARPAAIATTPRPATIASLLISRIAEARRFERDCRSTAVRVTLAIAAHVNVPSVDPSLAFAAELEERDAALSDRIDLLGELGRQVEEVRVRARAVAEVLERLPRDREQILASLADAERELEAAQATHARALRDVERARGEDGQAAARRHEAHAATDVRTTEDRRERLVVAPRRAGSLRASGRRRRSTRSMFASESSQPS